MYVVEAAGESPALPGCRLKNQVGTAGESPVPSEIREGVLFGRGTIRSPFFILRLVVSAGNPFARQGIATLLRTEFFNGIDTKQPQMVKE